MAEFQKALACFAAREFGQAETLLHEVMELRGGSDGPSEFYLVQIAEVRKGLRPGDPWEGVVTIATK